jgi:hypothetical protein
MKPATTETPLPKLYRMRSKDRKEFGPYYCNLDKKPVSLKTQDYFKARERAREAQGGKREFSDDRFFDENNDIKAKSVETPNQGAQSDDWTADAMHAAASGDVPYQYIPPPKPDEAAQSTVNAPKSDSSKPDNTNLPPELMEGLVKQIAATLVELQIHGQEYLWLRIGKVQPGEVHPDSDARKIPAAIWESAVRKWIPNDVPLPEWLVAPILVAVMAGTIQLEGARPIPKAPAPVT